jgi:hypothetical protein
LQQLDDLKYLLLKKEVLYLFNHKPKKSAAYYNKHEIDTRSEVKIQEFITYMKTNLNDVNRKIIEMVDA